MIRPGKRNLITDVAGLKIGNAEDAQDCVHDALSRVWRSANAYSVARGAVRSFLVVCVRNEAISRRRRQSRRLRLEERLAAMPVEHQELDAGDDKQSGRRGDD